MDVGKCKELKDLLMYIIHHRMCTFVGFFCNCRIAFLALGQSCNHSSASVVILNFMITRQNSTQSVGYMPPSPPSRHLLPHVLQIMPRIPKYHQFQSKGHQNEENPQNMTKIPKFDPFHEVKIVPKLEKSTNCDHNPLSSEDAQHTSACKMPGHFFNGFSR